MITCVTYIQIILKTISILDQQTPMVTKMSPLMGSINDTTIVNNPNQYILLKMQKKKIEKRVEAL